MRRDDGQTLIELLIAMVLLGIGVSGVLAAVTAGATLSGDHRDDATTRVDLLDLAEALKSVPYIESGTPASYLAAARAAGYDGTSTVDSVNCWVPPVTLTGASRVLTLSDFAACPGSDPGLQLLTLSPTTGREQELQVVVRRSS